MKKDVIQAIVFDAYGTLFDVQSIAAKINVFFPGKGEEISKTWREKQLEYANLRQLMGIYRPFSVVTKDALRYAVKKHGCRLDETAERALLHAYLDLEIFPEVQNVLMKLRHKRLVVFSNGSHDMLDPLVNSSGIAGLINDILSADDVQMYKPTPASYDYAAHRLRLARENILFVSSNGWDISGAKNYGFRTAWINRQHLPVEELNLPPDGIYPDLNGLLEWTM
ncbi:haloacid dehalogenase type II [Lentibacillus sediminis]|uniref:haloacid dehalogenase type II n=1 Tax=Lentibacillus sediminis TaxID=1940529 RepID=UPI001EFD9088|nr:haloacid dehalogenase type II [Lentibacillus sediminis]